MIDTTAPSAPFLYYYTDRPPTIPFRVYNEKPLASGFLFASVKMVSNEELGNSPAPVINISGAISVVNGDFTGSRNTWTYPLTIADPNGDSTATVTVWDLAGNVYSGLPAVGSVFTIDSIDPVVTLVNPPFSGKIRGTYIITGTAFDAYGFDYYKFQWKDGSNIWHQVGSNQTAGVTSTNNLISWDTTTTPDGTYPVLLTAFDAAGNYNNISHTDITVDNTQPILNVSYYSDSNLTVPLAVYDGKPVINGGTVYIKITASETLKANPAVDIITLSGRNQSTGPAVPVGGYYKYEWNVSDPAIDEYAIINISGTDTAVDSLGNGNTSTYSGTVSLDFHAAAPVLTASDGIRSITLNWSTEPDIVSYHVYRSASSGFIPDETNRIAIVPGPAGGYADSPLDPGAYYYKIKARDSAGNISAVSNETSADALEVPPAFTVEYYSDSGFTRQLALYGGKPRTTAGTVYMKITADKVMASPPAFTINAPGNSSNDVLNIVTDPISGQTYKGIWNIVSGAGLDGDAHLTLSGASADGGVATDVAPRPPTAGGGTITIDNTVSTPVLSASSSDYDVTLSWNNVGTDTGWIKIYRSASADFTPGLVNILATVPGELTSYQDHLPWPGTYYYKVVAIDIAGNISSPSNQCSIIVPNDVTPPSLIRVEPTSKQVIYLTFDEPIRDPDTAGSTINISGGLVISSTELLPDNRVLRLVLNGMGTGNIFPTPPKYTVTVQSVYDVLANRLDSATMEFEAFTPHGKYSPYPLAAGNPTLLCSQCHSAHSAAGNKLITGETIQKVCFVCHGYSGTSVYKVEKEFYNWDEVSGSVYSVSMHKSLDLNSPGYDVLTCADCHDPHGTRRPGVADIYPKLLRSKNIYGAVYTVADGNWFCLACHGFGDNGRFGAGFWDSTGGDHNGGMTVVSGVYNAAHYDNRFSLLQPASGTGVTCITCHERHGSENTKLTVQDSAYSNRPASANSREKLCYKCHYTTNSMTPGYDVKARFEMNSKHDIFNETAVGLTCSNCHGPHSVARNTFINSDATHPFDISDPLNTKTNWNTTSGDMSAYCNRCHDTDSGVTVTAVYNSTQVVPYTVTLPALTLTNFQYGWNKKTYFDTTSSTKAGHYLPARSGLNSADAVMCDNCHDPHGAETARLSRYPEDPSSAPNATSGMCLRCHGNVAGSPGVKNTTLDVWTPGFSGSNTSKHPTLYSTESHSDTENLKTAYRHAECVDCHDPHTAKNGTGQIDKLGAVSGVKYNWSGQWTALNQNPNPAPTQVWLDPATNNLQVYLCLKCHSKNAYNLISWNGDLRAPFNNPTQGWKKDAWGDWIPQTFKQTDVAREFSPNTRAKHIVIPGQGYSNVDSSVYGNFLGWDGVQRSASTVLKCTDCHGALPGAGKANGPHGSSNPFILVAPWNPASNGSNVRTGNAGTSSHLCFKCHDFNYYTGGTPRPSNPSQWQMEAGGNDHGHFWKPGCAYCHGGLPHGWWRRNSVGHGLPVNAYSDPSPYGDGSGLGGTTNPITNGTNGHGGGVPYVQADCHSEAGNCVD